MDTIYTRPERLKAKLKDSKAITMTSKHKLYDNQIFLVRVAHSLLNIKRIEECVINIRGITENHKDGSIHFHGIIDLSNPKLFFSKDSVRDEINKSIGWTIIKPIECEETWKAYIMKNYDQTPLTKCLFDD